LEIPRAGRCLSILFVFLYISSAAGQDRPPSSANREPPPGAYTDCNGKKAGDSVQHTTPDGRITATCVDSPGGLVARPDKPGRTSGDTRAEKRERADNVQRYSIEQAISDKAQLHTIAFDGLAFLTGDFGSDTFLPPGKVSDYFGFQYMRDIDAAQGGHNTSFLTRIADNMLAVLSADQKTQLLSLAKSQESDIRLFAEKRLPLIKAFRQNLQGDLPAGSRGLDKKAVMQYSADLYALDGELAYQRARVMGAVLRNLNPQQKAALARLKFGDSRSWPDIPEQLEKRSMSHEVNVAVMTYASEMFSWHAGSIEADAYFCPERHGMYFGGFGMKTAPAMGKRDYSISTSLTGDSGEAFLAALNEPQRKQITTLIDLQRQALNEIVGIRRTIAAELRRFLIGETADRAKVLSLSKRYGELDGEMSWLYATAFARVGQTLTAQQKSQLARLRASNPNDPTGPFLYSTPIRLPRIENTAAFFTAR
jgi:Spy/CpxP family protein refolding chaperone